MKTSKKRLVSKLWTVEGTILVLGSFGNLTASMLVWNELQNLGIFLKMSVLKLRDCCWNLQERISEDLMRANREVDTLRQQIEHLARYMYVKSLSINTHILWNLGFWGLVCQQVVHDTICFLVLWQAGEWVRDKKSNGRGHSKVTAGQRTVPGRGPHQGKKCIYTCYSNYGFQNCVFKLWFEVMW